MRIILRLMGTSALLAALSLLPVFPLCGPSHALMVEVSMDQKVEQSTEILRARVTSVRSEWTADRKTIMSHATLDVVESWAGKLITGESFAVSVEGGRVGEIAVFIEDEPVFTRGEDVILFLQRNSAGVLEVNAAAQGKYTVAGELIIGFDHQPRSFSGFRSDVQRAIREMKP